MRDTDQTVERANIANTNDPYMTTRGRPRYEILASWREEWLGSCADPFCTTTHHFAYICGMLLYEGEMWPEARITLRNDNGRVLLRLTKSQLGQYIADLSEMLEKMP